MIAGMRGIESGVGTLPGHDLAVRPQSLATPRVDPGGSEGDFSRLLRDAADQVSRLEAQAHVAVEGLMRGSGIDLHQAVIAEEKASMAFDFALAVRNKAIQSYQNVMGMQF